MNQPRTEGSITIGDVAGGIVGVGDGSTFEQKIITAPSTDSKPEKIEDLLAKLKKAIEEESNLNDKQRKKALNQLQILETASENPNNDEIKDKADDAHTILEKIISRLPAASALLNIGKEVLPPIARCLGI